MPVDPRLLGMASSALEQMRIANRELARIGAALAVLVPEQMTDEEFATELTRRLDAMADHEEETFIRKLLWRKRPDSVPEPPPPVVHDA